MSITMRPIRSSGAESFAYYGDREGYLIALSQHRDSGALERSNWSVITEDVLSVPDTGVSDFGDAAIERASHWAVGWAEYLLVRPGSPAAIRAQDWLNRLENYPVANEEHFSELEYLEEWCVRCDSGTREEHPTGRCGKFRSENDADEIRYRWQNR